MNSVSDVARAWRQQAALRLRAGQVEAARGLCRVLLADRPEDVQCLILLGVAASLGNDWASAVVWFERARMVAGDNDAARASIISPLSAALFQWGAELQGNWAFEEAAAAYRRALMLVPDQAEARINLATALRKLGQGDAAETFSRQALALQPASAPGWLRRGDARLTQDRPTDALRDWERGLHIEPSARATLKSELTAARYQALFQAQTAEVIALAATTQEGAALLPDDREMACRSIARKLARISGYFNRTIATYGESNMGISVADTNYHQRSLSEMARLLPSDGCDWSVNDFGCGYGAFFDHIADRLPSSGVRYHGYDVSPDMVARAQARIDDPRAVFAVSSTLLWPADYSIAAGIFNLNFDHDPAPWRAYVFGQLLTMARLSRRAFAFNALRPDYQTLFRMELAEVLAFVVARISDRVTVIDSYSDIEWTLQVHGPFKSA